MVRFSGKPMFLALGTLALAAANLSADAQTPDPAPPELRIRSPFGGPVWRLDVDDKEDFAVLSNASNAAAIWSFADPTSPLIARVPLREEQKKRARAVAMSPTGDIVAYAVPPLAEANRLTPASARIYVLRRSTGAIERIIGGADNDIATRPQALRFSPDGKHLAAVLSNGCGLRVWSTADWRLVAKDDAGYGGSDPKADRCCRATDGSECEELPDTTDVRFIRGGRAEPAILTSGDSGVRLYERAGGGFAVRKFASPEALGLERPEAIVVSPDEKRLAIGDRRGKQRDDDPNSKKTNDIKIAIVDAVELKLAGAQLQILESQLKFSGFILRTNRVLNAANLHRVAWLKADGREYIFAAGDLPCAFLSPERVKPATETEQDTCIARWTVGEEDRGPLFIPAGSDQVMDLVALQKRGGLLVATQKLIELVRPDGQPLALAGGKTFLYRNGIADFRDGEVDFKISNDARVVEFRDYRRLASGEIRLTFDLENLRITPGARGVATIAPNQDKNIIANWKNAIAKNPPVLWGTKLEGPGYGKDEIYRSAAILASRKLVLVGSSEFLRVIDYGNSSLPVICSAPVTAEVFRLNVTPDGAIAVSGHSDGTLRWYRIITQEKRCQLELLLSVYLFQEPGPRGEWRWIAWRPSGQFAQDSGAQMVMEWQTTEAEDRVLLTSFNQVGRQWYALDAVKAALTAPPPGRSPDDIYRAQTPDARAIRAAGAPAALDVEIRAATPIDKVTAKTMPLSLQLEKTGSWPKRVEIRVGDTRVAKSFKGRDLGPEAPLVFDKPVGDDEDILVDVKLPANVRMTNGEKPLCFYVNGVQQNPCPLMTYTGPVYKPAKRRLWAVLVGISRHDETALNLPVTENDVLDVAELFLRDYERRVEHKVSNVPADYQEIHINFAASPFSDEARNEAGALEQKRRIKQFEPTKAGIKQALEDMVARMNAANDQETGDDVFLFLFSGHGAIYAADGVRKTVFATKKTSLSAGMSQLEATSLLSSELFAIIDHIRYGQKIVVLDACRTFAASGGMLPSGGAFKSELDRLYLSVDFFFASDQGQASFVAPGLAFDASRKNKGNSVFTYALLESLTTGKSQAQGPVRVRIDDVRSYLKDFFSSEDEKSRIRALQAQYGWPYIQKPAILNARADYGSGVIRTLEGK